MPRAVSLSVGKVGERGEDLPRTCKLILLLPNGNLRVVSKGLHFRSSGVGGLTFLSARLDVHCRREAELKGRHFLCFPVEQIIAKLCGLFCLSQQGEYITS